MRAIVALNLYPNSQIRLVGLVIMVLTEHDILKAKSAETAARVTACREELAALRKKIECEIERGGEASAAVESCERIPDMVPGFDVHGQVAIWLRLL